MLLSAFDSVIEFLTYIGEILGLGWIAVIGGGLLLFSIIISFLRTQFSIELKTARAVDRLNNYMESNPFINEENLVSFNNMMKRIPKPMRAQWQKYMINRQDVPSTYLSEVNCIEKPLKTSSYKQSVLFVVINAVLISILCFALSLSYLSSTITNTADTLLKSFATPLVVVAISALYVLFLKARRNAVVNDLYFNFSLLQKNLDRAVKSLPEYVDYEILFTRKEITSGIPALQEYLQQRAVYEQEQIEKAKNSEVEHESYNFSKLGTSGAVVMEKAMRECEFYLGNRKRILAEIAEIQTQKDLLEKSYDEKNKASQRKLRDVNETLARLKEKLDATTNMIVGNDIRQQRENEIKKQQNIEKEIAEESNNYHQQIEKFDSQIDSKKQEIEDARKSVEKILNTEFKSFSDKAYFELEAIATGKVGEKVKQLEVEKDELKKALEERDKYIVEKNTLYDEKLGIIDQYSEELVEKESLINEKDSRLSELNGSVSEKDQEILETKKELESRNIELNKRIQELVKKDQQILDLRKNKQKEVYRYFDANGNEFFYDQDGNPYYIDKDGKIVYYENEHQESYEKQIEELLPSSEDKGPQSEEEKKRSLLKESKRLLKLQQKIEAESVRLQKEHEELKEKINQTITSLPAKEKVAKEPKKTKKAQKSVEKVKVEKPAKETVKKQTKASKTKKKDTDEGEGGLENKELKSTVVDLSVFSDELNNALTQVKTEKK